MEHRLASWLESDLQLLCWRGELDQRIVLAMKERRTVNGKTENITFGAGCHRGQHREEGRQDLGRSARLRHVGEGSRLPGCWRLRTAVHVSQAESRRPESQNRSLEQRSFEVPHGPEGRRLHQAH